MVDGRAASDGRSDFAPDLLAVPTPSPTLDHPRAPEQSVSFASAGQGTSTGNWNQ